MILVGIVALIFLGPRKLPELAKKAGKIMAEFRGTASEFKSTWEREVDFEEEIKSLSIKDLDAEPVARAESASLPEASPAVPDAPEIKAVDPETFKSLLPAENREEMETTETVEINDKKNWL